MSCFIINCCLIMWLINYYSFSVLKLAVCHRSGGNGSDAGQNVERIGLDRVSKLLDWVLKIGPTDNSGMLAIRQ